MSRDVFDRLIDIREALDRVTRLTSGLDFQGFIDDEAVYFAVIYSLGVVGEATKSLPEEVKALESEIDWRAIGRLRDLLFHVYFGIADKTIWGIVTESIPATTAAIDRMIAANKP